MDTATGFPFFGNQEQRLAPAAYDAIPHWHAAIMLANRRTRSCKKSQASDNLRQRPNEVNDFLCVFRHILQWCLLGLTRYPLKREQNSPV